MQPVLSFVSISTVMETSWTFLLTYWLHSTVLLGGLSLWKVRTSRLALDGSKQRPTQECRLWRTAILLPVATAALQTLMLVPCPVVRWEAVRLRSPDTTSDSIAQEEMSFGAERSGTETDTPENESEHQEVGFSTSDDPFDLPSYEEEGLPVVLSKGDLADGRNADETATYEADATQKTSASPGEQHGRSFGMVAFATPQVLGALSFLGILGFAFSWIAAHRRERHARPWPKDGKVATLLKDLCVARDVKRTINLLISPHNREPASSGLLRWKIFLPEGVEDRLTEDELRAVLAHELAHLVRGDVLWLWIGRFLGAAFAFQPLNRLARRRWSRASEFACDQWALDQGVRALTLARTLTALAELRLRPQPGLAVSAGVSRQGHLSDRVERLLHRSERHELKERRGAARLILAVVVIAVGALCCLLIPRIDFSQAPESDSPVAASDQSDADGELRHSQSDERDPLPLVRSSLETVEVEYSTDSELVLLQDTLDILDNELSDIETSLYIMRVSIGEDVSEGSAGARCLETLERLSSRAGRIREQRDRLASLIERWDEERE